MAARSYRSCSVALVCGAVVIMHLVSHAVAQAAPRDRMAGVPQSKRDLYMDAVVGGSNANFVCFDGTATIPGTAVNDDYCDCADGSDEPGTSACANGQFYCVNKGHVGRYISASLVNDGVCDCCDGSDEAANPILDARCLDTCLEAGATHRAEQAEAIRVAEEGARLKAALAAEGRDGVDSIRAQLTEKQAQLAAVTERVEEAELAVSLHEAKEREENARRDGSRDETVMAQLGLGSDQPGGTADALREVLLALVRRVNASGELVDMLNERRRETYATELQAFNAAVQAGGQRQEPLVPPTPVVEVEWPENVEAGGYTSPEADAARAALVAAEEEESGLNSEIATLEKRLSQDYGKHNEWWGLRDRCIETTASKYKYSVCPYKEAKQDHTRLGTWKGFKDKQYTHMVFSDGATCWNGPKRSITVELQCGLVEELSQVEEPSTCTYTAVLKTPAACDLSRSQPLDLNLDADGAVEPTDAETRSEL